MIKKKNSILKKFSRKRFNGTTGIKDCRDGHIAESLSLILNNLLFEMLL